MLNRNLPYDVKYLIKCLAGLLGMMAIMRVTGGAGYGVAFVILFTCFSRNNTELLFYTVLMTIALTMGNSTLVQKGAAFAFQQRILMLLLASIMIVRIAGSRKTPVLAPFFGLLYYVVYMIAPSLYGWNPIISFLKIFLFSMIYAAYLGVSISVINSARDNAKKIRSIFLMLAIFFVFGSVALLPFPGLATLSWDVVEQMQAHGQEVTSLFTGMTLHSQALGPICSALGVALYADLVFSIKKLDRLYLLLLICVPILIWKTGSRTAMGSFVAGVTFVTFFFMRARNIRGSWRSKVINSFLLVIAAISMVVIALPSARDKTAKFIVKFNTEDRGEVTFDTVTSTRRGKWDSAIYNFKQSPMIGNGFQVSEEMIGLNVGLTTLTAPVEKGVWVTAILEEGGVCGLALFVLFALSTFLALNRRKCYQGLAAFFMLLLINLGEFTIFSMTSVGGFLWALVFTGVILDALRMREESWTEAFRNLYGA